MKKNAIVGFGRAGHSAAVTLRNNGFDGSIRVYTDYMTGVENPMLTTYYATEKIEEEQVMPFGSLKQLSQELELDLYEGTTVTEIIPDEKKILYLDASGKEGVDEYDALILATGSEPFMPDFQAKDPERVITIRNIGDARRMNYALHHFKKVLVVGCSMIGIKVVQGLTEHDADITFIDMADSVFPTAVLPGSDKILSERIIEKGVKLRLNTGLNGLSEKEDGVEAEFTDNTKEKFDTVFLCMGTGARAELAKKAGISCGRAISVDARMQTDLPDIYAAGDCCETYELSTGMPMNVALWANAAEQGKIAAENILGKGTAYKGNLICNITHFWDTDFVSIGNNRAEGKLISCVGRKELTEKEWYFSAIVENKKIQCVNIIDNPELSGTFKDLMQKQFAGEDVCRPLLDYSFSRFSLPGEVAGALEGI